MTHSPTTAVFAEAKDPQRWREPIRNSRIAAQAEEVVRTAVDDALRPILTWGFAEYRRFDVDGDREQFQGMYFDRRKRMFAAAIGALLSDEVPIAAVEDLLWVTCDEYAWALPAHIPDLSSPEPAIPHAEIIDLYAAETAFALAEIVALLGDRLHPLVAARVRDEVERRVFAPFRERSWHWESVETNWSSVCAGSVGVAALHLDADGIDSILERCTAAMGAFLSGYGGDGICVEGLNYWNYGFGHFAFYAEALRQATGTDLWSGPDSAKLAAIMRCPAAVALGGRAVAAFSDAEPYGVVAPALAGFVEARDPATAVPRQFWATAGWDHNWGPVIRQFVWARDADDEAPEAEASATWFPDAGWFVSRDGDGIGFAAKAGHNDEPHNHNDLGSFVLAVDGEPLLSELGMGFYDGSYFVSETRYRNPSAGSQGHSVPLIGGVRQHEGADAAAAVEEVSAAAGRLVLDLTSGYALPGLRRARRAFAIAGQTLTIDDRFELDAPVEIVDRFVSLFPIALGVGDSANTGGGDSANTGGGDGVAASAVIRGRHGAVRLTWSAGWEPCLGELPFRTHGGDAATAHVLDLARTAADARCELVVTRVDG